MNGTSPKQLSKIFKINVQHVYLMVTYFKRFISESVIDKPPKVPKVKIGDDPTILKLIQDYFILNTLHHVSIIQLQEHLKINLIPLNKKIPSVSVLRIILKNHFHLQYKKFKTANYRYYDPTFNEKRLWVSRLLTQFLHDDAVIISLDETGFRSDNTKSM